MQSKNPVPILRKVVDEIGMPDMKSYNSRFRQCPVRGTRVIEYEIPITLVTRDTKASQVRLQDCNSGKVAEIRDEMIQFGQELGICVFWHKASGSFIVGWGNTRFRGAIGVNNADECILETKKGHIWSSLYEHSAKDLLMYQTRENNLHSTAQKASSEDNVANMLKMIAKGDLDEPSSPYSDMSLEEKRERVKKKYSECAMPARKFQSLWNRIRKEDPRTSRSMCTWDKSGNMLDYFNAHNGLGIIPGDVTQSGDVINVAGEKILIYFVIQTSEIRGAAPTNINWNMNINKTCDKTLMIMSLNDAMPAQVQRKREKVISDIKKWNATIKGGRCIDEIWFMPQLSQEQEKQLIKGEFVSKEIFKK